MKSVFIREIGIHPWDQPHASKDENYVTITLLNQNYESAWKTWCELSSPLTKEFKTLVHWHTRLTPYLNKTQEYVSKKEFSKKAKPGDIFRKNESTGIYSKIVQLDTNVLCIDPMRMTDYRTSITLTQKNSVNFEELWQRLCNLKDISNTDDFKLILNEKNSISFRFYDTETYGAAQIICHSEHLSLLNKIITEMKIEEIYQNDVYAYIHSQAIQPKNFNP
ncbi:hypothetical protein [Pseudomonas sp. lyk4-R2A-8]|uniref:hypothetical protein n=1 Tax=Pseudomonas sp. lyk4-R2A-8 TaxID=3040316 RepID=UPI0025521768|nr:hypothetical protein [Pseudomonas sp. lyk4-R2A-8]